MGEETSGKFCVICGVEEDDSDKEGHSRSVFLKDVKFGKFCGELELTSGLSSGEVGFGAFNFLQQLDKCSEFVKICEDCTSLISDTVDKRGELEEKECQVLELQIKLLIKLKELEGCSQLYLGEMGRIMEKVKGSQLNGLGSKIFGKGKGKCDVLGFREMILNVVTSLAMFQDNLSTKLDQNRKSQSNNSKETPKELLNSPPPSPIKLPPNWDPSMEDSSNDFDNISLSSPPPPPSPDNLEDNFDNLSNIHTEEESNLHAIKMEVDNPNDNHKEEKLNQDKPHPPPKKPTTKRRERAKINQEKFSKVNWKEMGPMKTKLIKTILTGPGTHSDNQFKKYKWTYLHSSDQIQFAGYPIQILEVEENGHQTITFECLTCDQSDQTGNGFKISLKLSANLKHSIFVEKTRRGVDFLKRKVSDHVLSFHLNCFNCTKCKPEVAQKLKLSSLRQFKEHLNLHSETKSFFCEICGRNFTSKRSLEKHLDAHLMKERPEEADKLKKFQCATCGRRFYLAANLKSHEDLHKPKEERAKVICSFCGKEVLKRCYSTHKKYSCPQQSRGNKMTCHICGKSYKNGKSLGDHLVRTHRLKERPKF